MNQKRIREIVKEQVSYYLEKIDNILEDIDQDVLAQFEKELENKNYRGHADYHNLIINLVREEVKRSI